MESGAVSTFAPSVGLANDHLLSEPQAMSHQSRGLPHFPGISSRGSQEHTEQEDEHFHQSHDLKMNRSTRQELGESIIWVRINRHWPSDSEGWPAPAVREAAGARSTKLDSLYGGRLPPYRPSR